MRQRMLVLQDLAQVALMVTEREPALGKCVRRKSHKCRWHQTLAEGGQRCICQTLKSKARCFLPPPPQRPPRTDRKRSDCWDNAWPSPCRRPEDQGRSHQNQLRCHIAHKWNGKRP